MQRHLETPPGKLYGAPRIALIWTGVLAVCALGGCQSTRDLLSTKNIYGPTGRKAQQELNASRVGPLEGQDEFDAAKKLFDDQQLDKCSKVCKKLKKKYKDKPIEEDIMFLYAECDFNRSRYPDAQDHYDELLKKYSSTRYLEQSTRRLFSIANKWLLLPKKASEVELASYTETGELPLKRGEKSPHNPNRWALVPNLTDHTRPTFDTDGRAIQCLTSVWLHDPTGPLADDALMMSATYHLRKHDYQEADRVFGIIREEYPRSEHNQAAYVLGCHAKRMAYQGARYDGKQLEEARKLTESTVRLFPEIPQRQRLISDMRTMDKQRAERDWAKVELYMKKKKPKSAAVYCEVIIQSYPRSEYAERARILLAKLGPEASAGMLAKTRRTYEEDPEEDPVEVDNTPGRVRVTDDE